MPATHHSSAPVTPGKAAGRKPARPARKAPPPDPPRTAGPEGDRPVTGRIPVLDVRPVVQGGRRPAKAVAGEVFEVSATVFREGHDAVAADVVLRDPEGRPGPFTPMRELAPGTDRWGATVSADRPGNWTYSVEAWSDPVATWRHTAEIKIPAGIDTEAVLEEGALLYERAAAGVPAEHRATVLDVVTALRDEDRPAAWRLASAHLPDGGEASGGHRGDGLRRGVPPADPPDRDHAPKGPQQHPDRDPGRRRRAVGDRLPGGRPRRRPPGSRHPGRLRALRGPGTGVGPGGGPGLRVAVLPGPPVASASTTRTPSPWCSGSA